VQAVARGGIMMIGPSLCTSCQAEASERRRLKGLHLSRRYGSLIVEVEKDRYSTLLSCRGGGGSGGGGFGDVPFIGPFRPPHTKSPTSSKREL